MLEATFVVLAIFGAVCIFLAVAQIIVNIFTSVLRFRQHQATYTKAGLTKREEYDEVSRRG